MSDFPHHGTCDQCAKGDRPLRSAGGRYPDAWICADCIDQHERGVTTAAEVAWRSLPSTVQEYYGERRDRWRRLVGEAVVAYLEAEGDPS